jgi:hypothetical protein
MVCALDNVWRGDCIPRLLKVEVVGGNRGNVIANVVPVLTDGIGEVMEKIGGLENNSDFLSQLRFSDPVSPKSSISLLRTVLYIFYTSQP